MTMVTDAEPHPPFACLTKGTSIQMPSDALAARDARWLWAAGRTGCPTRCEARAAASATRRTISVRRDDHQNEHGRAERNDDVGELLVRESAGRELRLRLIRARGQLSQLIVAERGHG